MKRLGCLAAALMLVLAVSASAEENPAVAQAKAAATSWLALADTGNYAQTWDDAAVLFQGAITKANWEQALKSARSPLGAVQERKLKSATFTRTLPGAPDGEYVVIQFETRFANKATAIETITPMREKDGNFRVSGYFVR